MQLTPHFNSKEFESTSRDAPEVHPMSKATVAAFEYLRDVTGVPWRITSSYRTEAHERGICAKYGKKFLPNSKHMTGEAADGQPIGPAAPDVLKRLQADILSYGPIFRKLRSLGIAGFGIYDTFVHLDSRSGTWAHEDPAGGTFAFWDERSHPTPLDKVAKLVRQHAPLGLLLLLSLLAWKVLA